MSRVLSAECEDGIVTYNGHPVQAQILSEGVERSDGILILDGEKAYYVAKTSPDTEEILQDLKLILDDVASILGAINTAAAAGQEAAIAALSLKILELDEKRGALR